MPPEHTAHDVVSGFGVADSFAPLAPRDAVRLVAQEGCACPAGAMADETSR
jgi:hypothetical protein